MRREMAGALCDAADIAAARRFVQTMAAEGQGAEAARMILRLLAVIERLQADLDCVAPMNRPS